MGSKTGVWRGLLVCLSFGAGLRMGTPIASASPPQTRDTLQPAPAPPAVHALSAIVIDGQTGAALWAKEPDRRMPPASTTKIVTGLLLARDVPLEQTITTSPNAAHTPGHALGMKPGETFTARDLLHAIMLASANDASVAVAEQTAGTEAQFAAKMNAFAQTNGAPNTHFTNASGLPAPDHYSTARDLAALARNALQNPDFAGVVRTRAYRLPRSGGRTPTLLTNENALLWTLPGMDGVKAGWTREAGACFVGSVTRNGKRLITVVLNSPNWQQDTVALLNYGFARYHTSAQNPSILNAASATNRAPDAAGETRANTGTTNHAHTPIVPVMKNDFKPTDVPNNGMSAPEHAPDAGAAPENNTSVVPVDTEGSPAHETNPASTTGIPEATAIAHRPSTIHNLQSTIFNRQSSIHNPQSTIVNRRPHFPLIAFAFFGVLLLAVLLAIWKGTLTMPDFLAGLFGRRRKSGPAPGPDAGVPNALTTTRAVMPAAAEPEFTFVAPLLERRDGRNWLETVLETPTRLLEPAVRRQACAILDADPRACEVRTLGLLTASNARMRAMGAELIAGHAPRLAEETLLALLKDEHVAADVRADAIQLLAENGGNRNERLWLQMLLRDGSAPAATALARLPRLEEATMQALKHILGDTPEGRAPDADMKRQLRDAHIACVLLAQGHCSRPEVASCLNALPANYGEPILVATLRGSPQPQAVECLVEIVLRGHAYPALQALLEVDPRVVRATLEACEQNLDRAAHTRATILRWLVLGEGSDDTLQELAAAGNDLARGALQLGRMNRRDPALAAPDAALAAVQITSLRLGFSHHPQEAIALAFRKAAADGEAQSLAALPREIQPLAQVYAHPDVYEAVQFAMYAEDGLAALLATLARSPQNAQYRRELAFWCDKVRHEHRLLLTHALCAAAESEREAETRTALESRGNDPHPLVRNTALRWLNAHPNPEHIQPQNNQQVEI